MGVMQSPEEHIRSLQALLAKEKARADQYKQERDALQQLLDEIANLAERAT